MNYREGIVVELLTVTASAAAAVAFLSSFVLTLAESCPQPASISIPRRILTVAGIPYSSSNILMKVTIALWFDGDPLKPFVGLTGITLTWHFPFRGVSNWPNSFATIKI